MKTKVIILICLIGLSISSSNAQNQCIIYNTVNSNLPTNAIKSIVIDANDTKWIGTWEGGTAKFDGKNWVLYDTSNTHLKDNSILQIILDKNNNKWMRYNYANGIIKFDNTNWTVYNMSNSCLPNNSSLSCIAIDINNNIWIGYQTSTLIRVW